MGRLERRTTRKARKRRTTRRGGKDGDVSEEKEELILEQTGCGFRTSLDQVIQAAF
jgi:hypothetical protein